MLCPWNRWRISKALDTDRSLPSSLERHLQSCDACRSYFRFSTSLPQKSEADLAALLSADAGDLSTRILAGLDGELPDRAGRKRRRPLLVPALSTALTVTAVLLGFFLLRPSPSPDLSQLNPLSEWKNAESSLSNLVVSLDSPYRTELENLRSSLSATAEFFRGFLDIRLGEEE